MSDPVAPEVRDWLRRTEAEPPDAEQSARQVMARLPQVRQRRRWWPFPVVYREPQSNRKTIDRIQHQPSSIPAMSGHTPTVIGRTQTMISPVKAITAGVIVFALGGVMLIAQPFEQEGSVPGAQTEVIAPTWVTGDIQPAPSCLDGDIEFDGEVRRSRNVECSPQTWTSSDPRLTGEVSRRWNFDTYQTDEGSYSVGMDAAYLRNEGGSWLCSASYLEKGSGMSAEAVTEVGVWTHTCTGEGGYEGLSALLVAEDAEGFSEEFVALIFSGGFPPPPEPPAAE